MQQAELQTAHELNNLKVKIQQMIDQYADLDKKFSENLDKLKQYEERDEEKTKEIEKLKEKIEFLSKTSNTNKDLQDALALNTNLIMQKQLINSQRQIPPPPLPPMTSVIQQLKQKVQQQQTQQDEDAFFGTLNRPTPMLDNEPSKFKSSLIKRGSLATRQLPQVTQIQPILQCNLQDYRNIILRRDDANQNSQEDETDDTDDVDSCNKISNDQSGAESNTNNTEEEFEEENENEDNLNLNDDSLQFNLNINQNQLNGVNLMSQPSYIIGLTSSSNSSTTTTTTLASTSSITSTTNQTTQQIVSFTQPVEEWSCESVAQWLAINDLSIYIDAFLDMRINGEKLISLDTSKLKVS